MNTEERERLKQIRVIQGERYKLKELSPLEWNMREEIKWLLHWFPNGEPELVIDSDMRVGRLQTQLNGIMNSLAASQREVERLRNAATRMRDACVEKVREYGKAHQLCHPLRTRAAVELIEILQSITLEAAANSVPKESEGEGS